MFMMNIHNFNVGSSSSKMSLIDSLSWESSIQSEWYRFFFQESFFFFWQIWSFSRNFGPLVSNTRKSFIRWLFDFIYLLERTIFAPTRHLSVSFHVVWPLVGFFFLTEKMPTELTILLREWICQHQYFQKWGLNFSIREFYERPTTGCKSFATVFKNVVKDFEPSERRIPNWESFYQEAMYFLPRFRNSQVQL